MQSAELNLGRCFGVTFEHGKDFFGELSEFCEKNDVRQAYVPMFIGALTDIEAVGTFAKLEKPEEPMLASEHRVHLENAEVTGCGTIAFDDTAGKISPHIHVSIGPRPSAGVAHTSHLFSAKVQFLIEMMVIEVLEPNMERTLNPDVYNLGILSFIKK